MARFGFVDAIENGRVQGWAYDDETRAPAEIAIYLDGEPFGITLEKLYRADVFEAGFGDGNSGFQFQLPFLPQNIPGLLSIRYLEDGIPLTCGEQYLWKPRIPHVDLYAEAFAKGLWSLEVLEQRHSETLARGWALPPFALPQPFSIALNGEMASTIEHVERIDVSAKLALPASVLHGFEARWNRALQTKDGTRDELQLVSRWDGTVWNPANSVTRINRDAPIPDAARRKRVGGVEDEESFKHIGATVFASLDRALHSHFGRSLETSTRILDWGCGCGRVFRYLSSAAVRRLSGVDIDAQNVEWCRAFYPDADFRAVSPVPPMSFGANTFDTVLGVSVLTHLSEAAQEAWLQELQRITVPGAALLLTVMGETAWFLAGLLEKDYTKWRCSGYWSAGKNFDLDDVVDDTIAYGNCFITKRYIFERWSAYFEVLDVLDGAIANHQDLVLLRRK